MSIPTENVAPALLLVLGAGASTGIGAAAVFIPSLVKLASRRVLASSLSFSAGVMTYVSFVEIFAKSNDSFVNAGHDENKAYIYATLCFFGGVITMELLNKLVDCALGEKHIHHQTTDDFPPRTTKTTKKSTRASVDRELGENFTTNVGMTCCGGDPVKKLNDVQRMASVLEHEIEDAAKKVGNNNNSSNEFKSGDAESEDTSPAVDAQSDDSSPEEDLEETKKQVLIDEENIITTTTTTTTNTLVTTDPESGAQQKEAQRLHKMGLNTAIAIGLHNFPEGLATFVAALQDPKVGAVLAVAIAIHNIPEGLCVALPIYYASGSRLKGFLWALLSGASEFVAALLGWAILAKHFSETAYAILFGLVAGMMIMISTRELLPTAHIYDKNDTVVSYSFIVGMVVMALSLCLFQV